MGDFVNTNMTRRSLLQLMLGGVLMPVVGSIPGDASQKALQPSTKSNLGSLPPIEPMSPSRNDEAYYGTLTRYPTGLYVTSNQMVGVMARVSEIDVAHFFVNQAKEQLAEQIALGLREHYREFPEQWATTTGDFFDACPFEIICGIHTLPPQPMADVFRGYALVSRKSPSLKSGLVCQLRVGELVKFDEKFQYPLRDVEIPISDPCGEFYKMRLSRIDFSGWTSQSIYQVRQIKSSQMGRPETLFTDQEIGMPWIHAEVDTTNKFRKMLSEDRDLLYKTLKEEFTELGRYSGRDYASIHSQSEFFLKFPPDVRERVSFPTEALYGKSSGYPLGEHQLCSMSDRIYEVVREVMGLTQRTGFTPQRPFPARLGLA